MKIPLTKCKSAIVDDKYHETLTAMASWCYQSPGYAAARINQRLVLMHRVIAALEWGPSVREVDHRDRNRLNNRVANLRYASNSGNHMNKGPRCDNTSGYKGVFWHKGARKWMAQVKYEGTTHYLGLFRSKHDAAKAYNAKAIELAGEFAWLNHIVA